MTTSLPDCAECRPLLSAFLDGEASAEEQQGIMRHLSLCAACQEEYARERILVADLQELPIAAYDTSTVANRIADHLARATRPARSTLPIDMMLPAVGTLTLIGMGWGITPCDGPTAALCLSGSASSLGRMTGHFDAHVLLLACGVAMGVLLARLVVRHWPLGKAARPFPRRFPLLLVIAGVTLLVSSLDPWVSAMAERATAMPILHLALHTVIFTAGLSIASGLVFLHLLRLPFTMGDTDTHAA